MPGPSVSHISQAYPDRVEVRGRDLTGDLMGRLTFTEYFHLLLTGDEPTAEQREFLDLLLVAIAEHGMMPTNVAARMTLAADPGALQGAVAAGILGAGPVLLGTSEECAKLLGAALARGGDPHAAGAAAAAEIRAAGGRVPGFGHPVHTPLDPRAERILELADARGVAGPNVAMARAIRDGVAAAWGRPLTMNVSMPIAAVLLDLGFDARTVKAIPILARTASLLAHLAEERDEPIGFGWRRPPSTPSPTSPRDERAAGAARLPARALRLLPREARRARRRRRARRAAADDEAGAPRHRLARLADGHARVRGAGRDRAHLLHERDDRHAELHPPHRRRRGELGHGLQPQLRACRACSRASGSSRPTTPARSWPAPRSPPSTASGSRHIPVGTGNTERLVRAIEQLEPEAVAMTPSYAAYALEWASERGVDLAASSVRRVIVAGEPGGGEPAFRVRLERGWGARVTEAMGIGDIGVSLWGECEAQDGMHLGAAEFVLPELIDPASGAAVAMEDGAEGELVLTHLRHRAAPLLRFRTRDHVRVKSGRCACGREGIRIRCVGRTDDMLIVRGVNVFPSAIREVVGTFAPRVSGNILVRPSAPGPKQDPPLPVAVEIAAGGAGDADLARAIREQLRAALIVQTEIELVPFGGLQRSEYKSRLVQP